jgi:hypothetical protein
MCLTSLAPLLDPPSKWVNQHEIDGRKHKLICITSICRILPHCMNTTSNTLVLEGVWRKITGGTAVGGHLQGCSVVRGSMIISTVGVSLIIKISAIGMAIRQVVVKVGTLYIQAMQGCEMVSDQ